MADNNQDDLFSLVEHGTCRCQRCMSKNSHSPNSDSHAEVLNYELSRLTARLPTNDKGWESFQRTMIERDAMAYLTEKRIINWCAGTNKLYAIKTTGDGNCLMHAVSLYMWQCQDELMMLRRYLHENMLTFSSKDQIRERWQKQREWQHTSIPGGLQYSNEEWDQEWQLLVNAAGLMTSTSSVVPFEFLEPIHVFVLANFLQRPIIILGEPYLRSITGDSIEANDFVGIYLPLISPARSCHRAPIVLAFLLDHFLPLLARRSPGSDKLHSLDAVPLVTAALEPIRIHFLLPAEEASAYTLLQQYLQLMEIERKNDDGCDSVLVARTTTIDEFDDYYIPVHEYVFRHSPSYPACPTRGCEFMAVSTFKGFCMPCFMGCMPFRRSLIPTGLIKPDNEIKICANVNCKNVPWLPTGGLCRLCIIGLTPKYYDLSFTECTLLIVGRKRTPLAHFIQDEKCSQPHCSAFAEVDFDKRKGTKDSIHAEKISCVKKRIYGRVPGFIPLCHNHAKRRTREMLNAVLAASGVLLDQSSHCATPGCVNRPFGSNSAYCYNCVRSGDLYPKSKCKTAGCTFPLYLYGWCCFCYWLSRDPYALDDSPDSQHSSRQNSASQCRMSGCSRIVKAGELYCSLHADYTTEYSRDYTSPATPAQSSESMHSTSSLYEKFCDKFGCSATVHAPEQFCPIHRMSTPMTNYSKPQRRHQSRYVEDEDEAKTLPVPPPVPERRPNITSQYDVPGSNYVDGSLVGSMSEVSHVTEERRVDPFDRTEYDSLFKFASSETWDKQRNCEMMSEERSLSPAVGDSIQPVSRRLFDGEDMEVDVQPDEEIKVKPTEILKVWKEPADRKTTCFKPSTTHRSTNQEKASEISELSVEELKTSLAASLHMSDDDLVERNQMTEVSEVDGVLEVAGLPQSTLQNSDDVSLVESTEAVLPPAKMDCIGPICKNYGLEKYSGLCEACYNVLLVANMAKVALGKQNQIAAITEALEQLTDSETRHESTEQQTTQSNEQQTTRSNEQQTTRSKCINELCHNEAIHPDEGLCDTCYYCLQLIQASADSKKDN